MKKAPYCPYNGRHSWGGAYPLPEPQKECSICKNIFGVYNNYCPKCLHCSNCKRLIKRQWLKENS